MKQYGNIIKTYAKALEDNDYQTIISLFSKDARVFSFLAGEQSPLDFFQNLFEKISRSKVEVRNIFIDVENKKITAADIYLHVMWNKKHPIAFEAIQLHTS